MNRKNRIILLFVFVVLITTIGVGYFLNSSNRPHPSLTQVLVNFINRSGYDIRQIEITHEKGIIKKGILKSNEQYFIVFNSPEENSYYTRVIFDNGKILQSKEEYTEGGYSFTEVIYAESIERKNSERY